MSSNVKCCPICTDKFTPCVRKEVTCPYCTFEACVPCVKQYLLGTTKDPHCMQCNVMWNLDFLNANLTTHWRTGPYRVHRATLLYDRERARLPETMPIVQLYKEAMAFADLQLAPHQPQIDVLKERLKPYDDKISHLQKLSSKHFHSVWRVNWNLHFRKDPENSFRQTVRGKEWYTEVVKEYDQLLKPTKCSKCDREATRFSNPIVKCSNCKLQACVYCHTKANVIEGIPNKVFSCYGCKRPNSLVKSNSEMVFLHHNVWNDHSSYFTVTEKLDKDQVDELFTLMVMTIFFARSIVQRFEPFRQETHQDRVALAKLLKNGIAWRNFKKRVEGYASGINLGRLALTAQDIQRVLQGQFTIQRNQVFANATGGSANDSTAATEPLQEKSKFILACPFPDCKGMLSTRYKCTVCDRYTCKDCREIIQVPEDMKKDAEGLSGLDKRLLMRFGHQCDPNTVETVKMIKADSKPCPSCASLIHRVYGCNQMWCTQCQVAFDWASGRIEKQNIHNPHYFEYLRQNGQNPEQVMAGPYGRECGVNTTAILRALRSLSMKAAEDVFLQAERSSMHLRHDVVRNLRYRLPQGEDPNRIHRVQFLLGTLKEAAFKNILIRQETTRIRCGGLIDLYTMFHEVTQDTLRNISQKAQDDSLTRDDVEAAVKALRELAKYVNYHVWRHCKNVVIAETDYVSDCMRVTRRRASEIKWASVADAHVVRGV